MTVHNGEVVTITGAGFGSKAEGGPLATSFDSAAPGDNWSTGTLGGTWETRGEPTLTAAALRTDHYQSSFKLRYDAFYPPYDALCLNHMVAEDKLYLSFWMYRDHDTLDMTTGSGNNSKFLRIYQDATGEGGNLVLTVMCDDNGDAANLSITGDALGTHPYSIDYSSPSCDAGFYSGDWFHPSASCVPEMQVWEHYEFYVDYASELGGNDTQVIVWKDGMTVARASGMTLNEVGQVNDERLIRVGQVSGGHNSHYDEYLDQVYIDTTLAHVFISERADVPWPDVADTTHTEVQVGSAWQDDAITFTVNQGAFPTGELGYVHVVTADGAVIAGPTVRFAEPNG